MLVVSEPHLRMKPSSLFAFAHCSKTCLVPGKVAGYPCIKVFLFWCYCEYLSWLKTKPLEVDQGSRLEISDWSRATSEFDSMHRKILVSSAKQATLEFFTTSDRSLTWSKNSLGPSMLPWGTPEVTGLPEEVVPRMVCNVGFACISKSAAYMNYIL